ncbi:MAG: FMN-binding glutamate synthase family protein [Acidobacteria bacterium]|nr:MAG: FMN-binding glutamate synthase family protein [Acidobacteriota bacterium]REK08445.1 MAG: FMN-binding glutamate synthase family protein [Acidobacteriota bacterium]
MIGPEMRQYWVANDKEETPFTRNERRWVYTSAKDQNTNQGFGTTEILDVPGYPILKHSAFPFPSHKAILFEDDPTLVPSLKIFGEVNDRRRPYRPMSVVNVSAMSFGSLGERAVRAINLGCRAASAYHNTGEGGISPYHLQGAELVYQLGTGYFGARTADGELDFDRLGEVCQNHPDVRALELKLSQGAKPGKGGILPAKKITAEISRIRGIPMGVDCISPNAHTGFDTVDGLIDFIERMAEVSGLPVGIKSAVGDQGFWKELCARMKQRRCGPDFIAVDGGEGGTGSAPMTFADHVSLPFNVGFKRVYRTFLDGGMTDRVVWIGSGKLGFPDRAAVAFAMGCDLIQVAREAMLAIGCIQAQKCHTNHCPAGVATQNRWLQAGLDVEGKAIRTERYLKSFRKELLALAHAAGHQHPAQFTGADIDLGAGINFFDELEDILGYRKPPVTFTKMTDYARMP